MNLKSIMALPMVLSAFSAAAETTLFDTGLGDGPSDKMTYVHYLSEMYFTPDVNMRVNKLDPYTFFCNDLCYLESEFINSKNEVIATGSETVDLGGVYGNLDFVGNLNNTATLYAGCEYRVYTHAYTNHSVGIYTAGSASPNIRENGQYRIRFSTNDPTFDRSMPDEEIVNHTFDYIMSRGPIAAQFIGDTFPGDFLPNTFQFVDVNNANLGAYYTSNDVVVSGIDEPVEIDVMGGEYRINGGAWQSQPGTVVAGDTVAVRLQSSNAYKVADTATLYIGCQSENFVVTTRAADVSPEPFDFLPQFNAELNSYYERGMAVSGIEQAVAISSINGQYMINNDGVWRSAPYTVNNGDSVTVRRMSAGNFDQTVSMTLSVGDQSADFLITTRSPLLNVDPFSFIDVSNAERNFLLISNNITVSGPEQPVAISIVGGQYNINGGSWNNGAGTVSAGDVVSVRRYSANAFESTVSAVLTIGNQSDSYDITTRAANLNVDPFVFIDKTNAEPSFRYNSNMITVSGPELPVPISIVNGSYSVNGGPYMIDPGTVKSGDTVTVRGKAADTYETTTSVVLTIGNQSDAFDITTRAAANNVDPFSFIDVTNSELSAQHISNTITVGGAEQAVAITIVDGEYSINNGVWTSAAGTVVTGDNVRVRRNAANSYETTVSAVLTIGNQSDAFDITTRAADLTVDPFTFIDVIGVELSSLNTSNSATIMGPEAPVSASAINGEVSINGGAWLTSGMVSASDSVRVRGVAANSYETMTTVSLTVGNRMGVYNITTRAAVNNVDAFTFIDKVNADLDYSYTSNVITVVGPEVPVSISVLGGEYSVNGGMWSSVVGYVSAGDTVTVRRNSANDYSAQVSAVLTIGNQSDSFDITTKAQATEVCETPAGQQQPDPAELAKLVESELVGLEFSLDVWDSWSNGYCADIVVTNTTDKAKPYPYGVHFTLPVDTQFTGTWNGDVQRDGENLSVIFPSWTQYVEANSPTLANEQFGFCAEGVSEPQAYEHYVPDFSNLSIDFVAHNVWNGGYCGHFELTYTGNEAYIPSPNTFGFTLPQSVEMTEYWNEVYIRDGDNVTVELPFWTHHIYQNTTLDPESGFCTVGDQQPCGANYNGGNSTIVELTSIEDTYVASNSYSINYGDETRVQSDGYDSNHGEYVSLLKWDMSSVPMGVAITGAELSLNIYETGGEYGLFAMNGDWAENTATWSNTGVDVNQGVLIGIIEADASGQYAVNFNKRGIALVQQWVGGGENHGLMIRSMGSVNGIIFDSSEDVIEANRPKFSITYKEGATPLMMPTLTKFTDGVDGYTGTEDSRIKSGSPNTNYGYYEYVTVDGLSSGSELVGLLKWDLSSMPVNANVVATEIVLTISDTASEQYNLYAMNGSWSEDTVTWNSADLDTNQGVLIGTVIPHFALKHTLVLNDAGVELVQGWIDGSVPNNGLIIRSAGTTMDMRFRSSEYSKVSKRPTINVTYY